MICFRPPGVVGISTRRRRRPPASVWAGDTPMTLAATAAPTRQSHQWFSNRLPESFHSSTVLPRADSVRTGYSLVRWSQSMSCSPAWKTIASGSPVGSRSREAVKVFQ